MRQRLRSGLRARLSRKHPFQVFHGATAESQPDITRPSTTSSTSIPRDLKLQLSVLLLLQLLQQGSNMFICHLKQLICWCSRLSGPLQRLIVRLQLLEAGRAATETKKAGDCRQVAIHGLFPHPCSRREKCAAKIGQLRGVAGR